MPDLLRERFESVVSRPEQELNLAEAALLIAAVEYPDLDVAGYLRRLDEMAETVRGRVPPGTPLEDVLDEMNRFLFGECGFDGNHADYYDPRNSFLNEVLDRKLGIPISLSVLYLEVGRRLKLPLDGVSFPGHFLVKLRLADGDRILDPFYRGVTLDEEGLEQRIEEAFGPQTNPEERLSSWLLGATKRDILVRMLRNLKALYLQSGAFEKALYMIDRILVVSPDAVTDVRDRGLVYDRLDYHRAAIADYVRYLELSPEAEDASQIRDRLSSLMHDAKPIN